MTTTKTKTQAALAAAEIRKLLKTKFPSIVFRVTSQNYSMGDNVRVEYNDGVKGDKIRAVIGHFQYGNFDGMTDSYNYDNAINGLPQTKYLHITREISDTTRLSLINEIRTTYANCENFTGEGWIEGIGSESELVWRLFQEREY